MDLVPNVAYAGGCFEAREQETNVVASSVCIASVIDLRVALSTTTGMVIMHEELGSNPEVFAFISAIDIGFEKIKQLVIIPINRYYPRRVNQCWMKDLKKKNMLIKYDFTENIYILNIHVKALYPL